MTASKFLRIAFVIRNVSLLPKKYISGSYDFDFSVKVFVAIEHPKNHGDVRL